MPCLYIEAINKKTTGIDYINKVVVSWEPRGNFPGSGLKWLVYIKICWFEYYW